MRHTFYLVHIITFLVCLRYLQSAQMQVGIMQSCLRVIPLLRPVSPSPQLMARHTVTRWRAAPWHRVTFVTLMPLLTPAIMTSNLTSAGTLAQYKPASSLSPVLQTVQPDTLTLQFYSFGLCVYHWAFQADICDSADVNIQHTDYEAGVKILCC